MNISEVKQRLIRENVTNTAYALNGGLPDERYVIERLPEGRWSAYYCEKGKRTSLRIFESEDEVCCFFLDWILRDPTVRGR
jgi:hypothetical protein